MKNKATLKRLIGILIFSLICFSTLYFFCIKMMELLLYPKDNQMAVIISAVFTLMLILPALTKKREKFKNIEYGSSRWGTQKDIKPYIDKEYSENILLSDTERLSMDMRKTRRNRHIIVYGGSGSGKSRYYVKPNVLQMNASYCLTDPSKEHLRDEGKMLLDNGYKIKVFDTINPAQSLKFNPFKYFTGTKDIRRFVNMLMQNTSGDNSSSMANEDFWTKAERLWLMANISYVAETCLSHEQNILSVITLLDNSQAKDDDEDYVSAVDLLFRDLEVKDPQSFAAKQYKKYRLAAGKTAKSILISIGVRLADFDIPEIANMFSDDELELEKLGEEKTALFVVIDDTDTTYNYLAALLFDVMWNVNKTVALKSPNGSLKIPLRCIMDEIANIGKFPQLHILIAVLRKYGISIEPIFQSRSQLKAMYKDNWGAIEDNCDSVVFLGGKGEDTVKYVSEILVGKATITTSSTGGSGSGGSLGMTSYNSNEQHAGRNLIDETEVSRLADDECIISIRGLPAFKSKKIKTEKHKNYKYLADYDKSNTFSFANKTDFSKVNIQYVTQISLEEEV